MRLVLEPLGRFVYTINVFDESISMYTIDQETGVLTATSPPTVSTVYSGQGLVANPNGTAVYHLGPNAIHQYAIDSSGKLSDNGTIKTGVSFSPELRVDANGYYLYLSDWYGSTIHRFTIGPTGELTATSPASFSISGGFSAFVLYP